MKKYILFGIFLTVMISSFAIDYSAEEEMDEITAYTRDVLISQIGEPRAPYISDGFVIFTAEETARFVGIAFEYENFRIIHPFVRRSHYESDGEPVDSVLFYITKYPKELTQITYRLVIDGMWTRDPLNPESYFDKKTNTLLSTVKVESLPAPVTEKIADGVVRFVYYGESGQSIRLGGTFNNWDSYMYKLKEVAPGRYQIDLPLPSGKYFYNFYSGTNSVIDTNTERSYTPDGRVASVLYVR